MARRLTHTSRRSALRALAAAALGLVAPRPAVAGAAGCAKAGKPCKRGARCCSGRCDGPKGKKTCRRAPGQSICTIKDDICAKDLDEPGVDCGVGATSCDCMLTAAGRAFCSDGQQIGPVCSTDVECVAAVGEGAACVRQRTGRCNNGAPVNTCFRPCPNPI